MSSPPSSHARSWDSLSSYLISKIDPTTGPTNPQALVRPFSSGLPPSEINVTLFRDHHAWCPYCQKIWLYLEEHEIPYKVKKVTMFCYGDKEDWYKRICPSGMLPAIEMNGRIITESDDILFSLDSQYGPIPGSPPLSDEAEVLPIRRLERKLFGAWCEWLCRRHIPFTGAEKKAEVAFRAVAKEVDDRLAATSGPYFLSSGFSVADIIITPYLERMSASLTYYKGYEIRREFAGINAWFDAMESRETYRGTQSDFHTHAHDLPPQMGCCVSNGSEEARVMSGMIDGGVEIGKHFEFETSVPPPEDAANEALTRVWIHREQLVGVNPTKDKGKFDEALRAAMSLLTTGEEVAPPAGTAGGLRYLRDRVSVPRDMSLHAGRKLRIALEKTAALDERGGEGPGIGERDRRDQNPVPFVEARARRERAKEMGLA